MNPLQNICDRFRVSRVALNAKRGSAKRCKFDKLRFFKLWFA